MFLENRNLTLHHNRGIAIQICKHIFFSLRNLTSMLNITEPPRNMTIAESQNRVVLGVVNQKRNLTCVVETGKPAGAMYWEYRHEVVANGGPGSLTYTFTPDKTHHLQTFRCVAFNNVTRSSLMEEVMFYVYCKFST